MIEIEKSSGNVYADLEFANAGEMLLKAKLAAKIGEIISARGLSQIDAARILGISQPRLSNMLRGHFRGISEAKMIESLTRLGRNVSIIIGKESRKAKAGRVEVVSA